MKFTSAFCSNTLGNTTEESFKTVFRTITVDKDRQTDVTFCLSVIFLSEGDNDSATVKVFLASPAGHNSPTLYDGDIKWDKKDQFVAIGLKDVKVPFLSEGEGNYYCIVEINGNTGKPEPLFELNYLAPSPLLGITATPK